MSIPVYIIWNVYLHIFADALYVLVLEVKKNGVDDAKI